MPPPAQSHSNDEETSNAYSVVVEGESKSENMKVVFNINNLKLIEDADYEDINNEGRI